MAQSKTQKPQPARPQPSALPPKAASTERTSTWQVFNDFASI